VRRGLNRLFFVVGLGAGCAAAPLAFAGSLTAQQMEPGPVAAQATSTPAQSWTGGYIGAGAGANSFNAHASSTTPNIDSTKTGGVGGVFAGYNYQMGKYVIGGEIGYYKANDYFFYAPGQFSTTLEQRTTEIKLRAGYDLGKAMVYGSVGWQRAEYSAKAAPTKSSKDGYVVGLGADYRLTQHWVAGGELDYAKFTDVTSSKADLSNTILSVRLSYLF
jgi:outer membrane immunogenic protein